MKYSAVVLGSLISAAVAVPNGSSNVAEAPTATVSLTPQQSCAVHCDPADTMCKAACFGAAHPNSSQAVDTVKCAAKCDQGDGSPEATKKYADCQAACFASFFPTTQTGMPKANGPASSAAGTGTDAKATGTDAEATGTATGTGAKASSTKKGAANAIAVDMGAAGIFGLVMAVFAL